jgi:hypothetical protein
MLIPEVFFLNKLEILHEPCSKGTLQDQGKPAIDAEVRVFCKLWLLQQPQAGM